MGQYRITGESLGESGSWDATEIRFTERRRARRRAIDRRIDILLAITMTLAVASFGGAMCVSRSTSTEAAR